MDNVVSGLMFLLLGFLAFLSGLSANMWRRDESRYRIGAIIAGLVFMILEPVSNDFALTTEATERLLLSDTTSIWCKVI